MCEISMEQEDSRPLERPDGLSKGGASEQSGSIRGVLITSGFTLLGGVLGALATGYFNYRTEDKKATTEIQVEQQKAIKEIELYTGT
jgi:hypothetical protein